jgi:hypothetical protein
MRVRLLVAAVAVLSCGFGGTAITALPAHAAGVSQIVLSCSQPSPGSHDANGCASSELVSSPPIIKGDTLYIVGGFWVWCQSPNGGTPYGPDCGGSMYVEEINLGTGAGVYDATSVSGGATATGPTGLQVTFTSSDGDMSCTLNAQAGSSTLPGTCDGVPITFSNSIVRVT